MTWVSVVDISRHQGSINFATMRAKGVAYLIMRVSHGMAQDDRFATYYRNALTAGYEPHQIAFYSFINPKRGTGPATAQFAAEVIKKVTGRTAVSYMLDVENYANESPDVGTSPVRGAEFSTYLKAHIAAFKAAMPGSYIFMYSNRSYWDGTLGPRDSILAAQYEWLVPRYPLYSYAAYDSKGYPPSPDQWDEYAFRLAAGPNPPAGATWSGWQFSAGYNRQGPVYGCASGDLDLNILKEEAAARWFAPPYIPPTQPPIPIGDTSVFVPINGVRLLDSQVQGNYQFSAPPGIPAEATGLALNLTFLGSLSPGYLTLWDGSDPRPGVSQLNWTGPNAEHHSGFTVVKLKDGKFSLYAHVAVNILVDCTGYTMPPVKGDKGDPGDPGEPGAGTTPEEIVAIIVDELRD